MGKPARRAKRDSVGIASEWTRVYSTRNSRRLCRKISCETENRVELMPNIGHPYIEQRLEAIYNVLMGSYRGGMLMSSAAKGAERELFVKAFLSQVFPPSYRFGMGDITDSFSNKSGQVDIVAEFPYLFSFPMYPEGPRLYLAEGVAAVIEVKSNIAKQWDEVLATAKNIMYPENWTAP